MDGASRTGSAKGKTTRKNKKRGSKKRPVSSTPTFPTSQPGGGAGAYSGPDRYHVTSFPLVSDISSPVQEDSSSRMSWCGEDEAWGCLSILLLPTVVQLKIFAFLPNVDKGRAAMVCRQWADLLRSPSLWDRVSFSQLPQSCLPSASHSPTDQCYSCFQCRVFLFAQHVERLCPILHYLEFKFDISDSKSKYLQMIERLLSRCLCRDLRVAHVNWKETPSEPLWLGEDEMARCEEVVQKHRFRQRLFIQLFERLTGLAPRISTLVLPFDWSDSSIACLGRLKGLQNLVVEKYFVFQHLPQQSLDHFLAAVPNLTRLLLEVWTPSAHGMLLYTMGHKSLQYLDISQSRGFYLQALNMPNMRRFRVARHPWNGPLVLAEHVNIICLHTVLAQGAPKLTKINDHYLEPDWQHRPSDRLEEVLKGVCSCRRHKTGWAMY
ncbi:uncharacterized protein LOC143282176 [Babylonia areolata]|uniref:uncharacterized protein LOC143282176 n=1 Tax=Babylonia areolata TaxID=304850 RepID=UPI003FD59ADB